MGSSGLFSKETKTNETNFLQREEALLLQARAAYVRRTTELFPIRRQVEQIEARRQLVRPSAQGLRLQQNETRQTADASILMQCIFVSQALWRREGCSAGVGLPSGSRQSACGPRQQLRTRHAADPFLFCRMATVYYGRQVEAVRLGMCAGTAPTCEHVCGRAVVRAWQICETRAGNRRPSSR